jgi:hypothetical protein
MAEMELGSENSALAESQTQKASRKKAEAEAEKEALNSAAVTNPESVEEAAVSETSQTAESSLEKSVNVGVAEDKVSMQEEEALGKEAEIQSQSVSENEAAKQKQNTSGNEGVFFNQSSEGENKTILDKTPDEISNMTRKQLEDSIPDGWDFQNHNGRVHIKDENGNYRVRIDPPDKKTNYTHIHIFDENKNPLDIDGNIVLSKDPSGHIPYNN